MIGRIPIPFVLRGGSLTDADRPAQLHDQVGFAPRTITGYEVPIQWPYVDGRLYVRTLKGLACFDLRQPPDSSKNQTLRMTVPARVAGFGEDLKLTLIQRDGKLTHGGFRQSRRLHAVDVSGVQWDGRYLNGTLRIDVNAYRRFDDFHVDAELGPDDTIAGSITRQFQSLQKPLPRRGAVTSIPHQPNWMPDCTHVLQLQDAAIQQSGRVGRLLLFLTVDSGNLTNVEAFADQTTQSRPVLDASQMQFDNGRLTGVIRVLYRADEWAQPLAERSDCAAAVYAIDATLGETGEVGSYEGTYGVAWNQTADIGVW